MTSANKKKTILMLCDHPLCTSGVATQARWLINGLIATGKYQFRVFGGAIRHDNYDEVVVNEDFVIKPTDGFGDKNLLRLALAQLKPDAILLFTDPRFFIWAWEMEDEIHQICPITYNHLWDNPPFPEFNRVLYESTDLVNCINYPTYEMVHERFPEKTNYIPHAVPKDLYKPLPELEVSRYKRNTIGIDRADHFVALYVSRNARRKMPGDILVSWKMFIDDLKKKHGHTKATLIMHADPLDPEGANLHHVLDVLKLQNHVMFSKERMGFPEMNLLYNMSDTVINRSCFVAGSKVLTQNGFVPIEHVQLGDLVLTHKKRWRSVVDLIRNDGKNKKIISIKYDNGNPINCTDDHKIMAIKKSSLPSDVSFVEPRHLLEFVKLTKVNELCVDDYVVAMHEKSDYQYPKAIDIFAYVKNTALFTVNNQQFTPYNVNVNDRIQSTTTLPIDYGPKCVWLDEHLAYIMGVWASKSNINSKHISFNIGEMFKLDRYLSAIKHSLEMDCYVKIKKNSQQYDVTIKNGNVVAMMLNDKCGISSGMERIPTEIKLSSKEIKESFLKGYFVGKGHMSVSENTIVTRSPCMAADLRQLLIDINHIPNVTEDFDIDVNWRISWTDKFLEKIYYNVQNIDNTIISKITSIENKESENVVYDLTVDEDHTYMVENVTVSNCNEGFGLGTLEAMMCAKPIIALKTGGLTRQVQDAVTNEQYGIALEPEVKSLVGNQLVPYIYEDFVSHETVSNAFMKMYEMGPEARAELGKKAMEHAHKDYDLSDVVKRWDETLSECIDNWKNKQQRWTHTEL